MDYKKLMLQAQQEQEKAIRLYEEQIRNASKHALRTATALTIVGIATLLVCLGVLLFM